MILVKEAVEGKVGTVVPLHKELKLAKVSDVLSRSNLEEGSVMKKEEDLKKAFELGVQLVSGFGVK